MPIKDSYHVGRYKTKVRSSFDGKEIREFHQYGREPKIGSNFSIK